MLPPNVLFMKPMARCLVSLHLSLRFILSHLRGALTPYLYIHTHANTSIFDISHCSPPSRRSSTELPLDGQSLSSMLGTLPGLSFNLPLSSRHDNSILPPQNPSLFSSRVPSRSQTPLSISHPTPPLQQEPFILPSHRTTPFPSLDPSPSSSHHPSPFPSRHAIPILSRRASPIPSRCALVATNVSQSGSRNRNRKPSR